MEVVANENRPWPVLKQFMRNKLIICLQFAPMHLFRFRDIPKSHSQKMAEQSSALYRIEDSM